MNLSFSHQQTSRYGLVFAANIVSQQSIDLPDSAFRLWILLHTYVPKDPDQGWKVSAERLSLDAGFSRSTFFRALSALKDSKLIRVESSPNTGECNRYYLLNASGVRIDFNGQIRGVITDTGVCQQGDTGGVSSDDTHTGLLTGAPTSSNPLNPPRGDFELQGFIDGLLDELYQELEGKDSWDQCVFLLEEAAQWTKPTEFNFREVFKTMCQETAGTDPICCSIGDKIHAIAPPENKRRRSANKRYAFLTECHQAIRDYGIRM